MKFASDPVLGIQTTKTGAPHQNTPRQPIMQDVNQEGKEEKGNTPAKEMGIGLEAGDIDERSIAGENVPPSIGDETVDTIGQVRLVIVVKLVQQLQETYDDSVGTSAFSAAAKASSEFVQQKVVEHKKVLV